MKIKVPEGMLKAALEASSRTRNLGAMTVGLIIVATLRWLSENPIVPTLEQVQSVLPPTDRDDDSTLYQDFAKEWQRIMFAAHEPEAPEAIRELLWMNTRSEMSGWPQSERAKLIHDEQILEAYRRGQKSGQK